MYLRTLLSSLALLAESFPIESMKEQSSLLASQQKKNGCLIPSILLNTSFSTLDKKSILKAEAKKEGFQKSIEDWHQTQSASEDDTMVQPSPANMTRIWTTVVGGPKEGKTYGLGVNHSSSSSSPMLCNSTFISQTAEEIEAMRTKIKELMQYYAVSDAKFAKFEVLVTMHKPQVFKDGENSDQMIRL
ncbi:hypothetical protein T459_11808 [Capsicum annuum]|uniref:Uncharacterized protein n=1 Tax=Capsicum annuum TaxID=4072 RepID=A0A2G2ZN48_CAPAN|nr:hypothetical protein T459_11808 [Capsicum annuum]